MNTKEFTIKINQADISVPAVKNLLSQSYWASDRTSESIKSSIENSICYTCYIDKKLVGFGRVVTDYSTVFWICDIIIDENFRAKGYGQKLMETIMHTKDFDGLLGVLATKDAHNLYEKYGFERNSDRFMKRPR
ncbi:GNAT family N-acetyltransferase [Fusibacter sp. JL216-2]|uniref:GNAT family N-acetyltransferase n=1 Tax=Fusibacter sp. JL216-2 TaxID=3071453 RepID=UPI003D341D12